jgi:hypothetical protein
MISLPYEWDDIAVAMPSAPAGRSSTRAALRRLGHTATIGIALANLIYFGGQLLRAVF